MDKSESTETESTITCCSILEQVTQRKLSLRSVSKIEHKFLRSKDIQLAKARKIWKEVENHRIGHCQIPQNDLKKLRNKLLKILSKSEDIPTRALRRCRSEIQFLDKILTKASPSPRVDKKNYWPRPDVTFGNTTQEELSGNLLNESFNVTNFEENVDNVSCKSPCVLPPLSEVLECYGSQLEPFQNHRRGSNSISKKDSSQADWQPKCNKISMNEELAFETVVEEKTDWGVQYKDLLSCNKLDGIYKESTPPMFESESHAEIISLKKDSGHGSCEDYSKLHNFLVDMEDKPKSGYKDAAKKRITSQSYDERAPTVSDAGFSATFEKNLNKLKASCSGGSHERSFKENILFGDVKSSLESIHSFRGKPNGTYESKNYLTYDVVNDFKLKNDFYNARFRNTGIKESSQFDSNELFLKEIYNVCRSQCKGEDLNSSLNWKGVKDQEPLIHSTYLNESTQMNIDALGRSYELSDHQLLDTVKYILTDNHVSEIASTINIQKRLLQSVIENVLIDRKMYRKEDDTNSVICPSPLLNYSSKRRYSQRKF